MAYLAKHGTPRVIPMLFHWDGTELVLPTFAGSYKVASMRRPPAVAVTPSRSSGITATTRGANTEQVAQSGAARTRIVLRPEWVGVLDFQSRFPGALVASGVAEEDGS